MNKKERIIIDELSLKKLIDGIGFDELKILRKESTQRLSTIRKRDRIFFTIYLQKEYVDKYEQALDWAFKKGLIKKRTRWAFAKFAITNVITMIMEKIEKEQVIQANDKTAQRIANPLTFGVAEVRYN